MNNHEMIYFNGSWTPSQNNSCIQVVNPATELVIGTIPAGCREDVEAAVTAAQAAFSGWSKTTPEERSGWLEALYRGLLARQDELADVITAEMGMPLQLSRSIQVDAALQIFREFSELAVQYSFEEDHHSYRVLREPAGVAACITPWNYPLFQIAAKIAPALAAGCSVVLKPSELAPLDAFILAEVVEEIGLPPGVFNLVSGCGEPVGEALVSDSRIDMISFTGSTRAGRRIGSLASRSVKRVALELGGKSPSIVLPDADLPLSVRKTVESCFLNSGQTCNSLTRLLVPEQLHDMAAELAVSSAREYTSGNPLSDKIHLGPLISAVHRDRVWGHIRQAIAEGAELLLGGDGQPEEAKQGYYVRPTVFSRVTPQMTIAREEVFGPVLVIQTFRDEEEAIALANDTPYGLAAAVWTQDISHAMDIARRLRAGQVDINGGSFNFSAPFGGYKQSGNGREMGRFGLEEFMEIKAVQFPA